MSYNQNNRKKDINTDRYIPNIWEITENILCNCLDTTVNDVIPNHWKPVFCIIPPKKILALIPS